MAEGNAFKTDMATMQVAAKHVDEVANSIDGELRRLDGQIQPIMGSWKGAGASAYMALHERYNEDARKLRQVLAEISQSLVQNATRYQNNEDAVVAKLKQTTGRL
jgi:WXG100 family type VII secretion target